MFSPPGVSATTLQWRRPSGQSFLTVIAKVTCRIAPDVCEVMTQPDVVVTNDQYRDGDPNQELLVASDWVPHKSRVDVIVQGSAYPREGAGSIQVRLSAGSVSKSMEVFPDRTLLSDGSIRMGRLVGPIPLSFTRATGGADTWNPVGVSPERTDVYGRRPLPNCQPSGLHVTDGTTAIPPIGLGPISPRWRQRRALWRSTSEPSLDRLADDLGSIDPAFFNAAPFDQQVSALHPRDTLLLEGLSPKYPVLRTSLPEHRVEARLGERVVPMQIDTLVIDSDRQVCNLTWRGTIDLLPLDKAVELVLVPPLPDSPSDEPTFGPVTSRGPGAEPPPGFGLQPSVTLGIGVELPAVTGAEAPPWLRSTSEPTTPVRAAPPPTFGAPPPIPLPPPSPPRPVPPPPGSWSRSTPEALAWAPHVEPEPGLTIGQRARAYPSERPGPPARVVPLTHSADAAFVGATAASDAAAEARPRADASELEQAPGQRSATPIDLLWFSGPSAKRVRVYFRALLAEQAEKEEDVDPALDVSLDDPEADRARREILAVLTQTTSEEPSAAPRLLEQAVDEQGRFAPPLAVFEATLQFVYPDVARLRVMVEVLEPLLAQDKRLKELCEAGQQVLGRARPNAGGAATRAIDSIREHVTQNAKLIRRESLESMVADQLLEDRAWDSRPVFGEKHLRMALGKEEGRVPAYVVESVSDKLPLFDSFRARVLAEVHARQDRSETCKAALRLVAVARVLELSGANSPDSSASSDH
ncbi:MAG: DUF2169 domain-containing protein [Polyangiaceae bacterium]